MTCNRIFHFSYKIIAGASIIVFGAWVPARSQDDARAQNVTEAQQIFEASPQPEGFKPPVDEKTSIAVEFDPVNIEAGILGQGDAHSQASPYVAAGTRFESSGKTHYQLQTKAAYVGYNSRLWIGNDPERISEEMAPLVEKSEYSVDPLAYGGIQNSVARALHWAFLGPFLPVAGATQILESYFNLQGDGGKIDFMPGLQADESMGICFDPNGKPFGAVLSAGYLHDVNPASGLTENLISGNDIVIDQIWGAVKSYPHFDLTTYLRFPKGGLIEANADVLKTPTVIEQKYALDASGKIFQRPASAHAEYRRTDSPDWVEISGQGITAGIRASPFRLGGLDLEATYARDFEKFGNASRDSQQATLAIHGVLEAGRKIKSRVHIAHNVSSERYATDAVSIAQDASDPTYAFTQGLPDLLHYQDLHEEAAQLKTTIVDFQNGLTYSLLTSALSEAIDKGKMTAISAWLERRPESLEPIRESDRDEFKEAGVDVLGINAMGLKDKKAKNFENASYDDKTSSVAEWFGKQLGLSDEDNAMFNELIANDVDSAMEYLFELLQSQGNEALLEAIHSGQNLAEQISLSGGLKTSELSHNALLDACWRVRRNNQ
ncbi:MAG: hypothetical protein HY547_10025 [Elusimicrobia bacterium]|nr:hypothetical protein [Elusimicrobiota bacterium]